MLSLILTCFAFIAVIGILSNFGLFLEIITAILSLFSNRDKPQKKKYHQYTAPPEKLRPVALKSNQPKRWAQSEHMSLIVKDELDQKIYSSVPSHGASISHPLSSEMPDREPTEFKFTFKTQNSIVTKRELLFYRHLCSALPAGFKVMAKVRMEDLFRVADQDFKESQRQRGHIKSRHFDFVIVSKSTLKPVCAVELDDSTHQRKKQIHGDNVKNEACHSANFKLFRVDDPTKIKHVISYLVASVE